MYPGSNGSTHGDKNESIPKMKAAKTLTLSTSTRGSVGICRTNGIGCSGVPGYAPAVPTIHDWHALDVRVGTVVRAEVNEAARDPALKLWIDFGGMGELQSSAKITDYYDPDSLVGRQVAAVTGLAPIRVAGFRSDVLVLGALTDAGVVLLAPDTPVSPGSEVA